MTAISWREPAPAKTRGAHRRPAAPRPRKRLLPGRALRKLARRAAFEVAVLGGMVIAAGWIGRWPAAILGGSVILAGAIVFAAVMT